MHSRESKGSMFYLEMNVSQADKMQKTDNQSQTAEDIHRPDDAFNDLVILIIDNDELLLEALKQQLNQWSDHVIAVRSRDEWLTLSAEETPKPDVMIADYHLDDGDNGIQLAQEILQAIDTEVPVIICSADASEWLREAVSEANYSFIRKPIKALALRKLISRVCSLTV
jgi:DNA-binding NtrC family response regulator